MAKPRTGQYIGRTGFVDDIAQAIDIRGERGAEGPAGAAGSGGNALEAASQSEAEGGTENTKFMTALRVLEAIEQQVRDFALTGSTDKVEASDLAAAIVARLLPTITDAATDMGKIVRVQPSGSYALEDFTPSSGGLDQAAVDARVNALVEAAALVAGTLTALQQEHFRGKIGAAAEGEWDYIEDVLGDWQAMTGARNNLPTDTRHILPDNCVTLRVRLSATSASFVSIPAADLRRKARIVGAQTALDDSNSISFTDPHQSGGDADDLNARVALDARGYVWVYVDQAAYRGTGTLRSRRPRHASWSETDPNAPEFIEDKPTGLTDAIWRALRQKVGRYPENPVQIDWDATSGPASIANKPDIVGAPRAVQSLPATGTPGERLELINPAGDTVARPAVVTPTENRDVIGVTLPIAGRSRAIALFGFQKTGNTANRLIVGRIPSETRIPAAAVIDGVEYALQRQAGIGASDYISAVLPTAPLAGGTPAGINVRFTDGSYWFAPVHVPRGFYEFTFFWGPVTAALNDAAIFAKLHDGTIGLPVTTDRTNQTNIHALDTPFTLPGDHIEGELGISVTWSSNSQIALGEPTHRNLFFLSDLRATEAYVAGTHLGLLASAAPVTTAPGGTAEVRLVQDASGGVGLVVRYVADGSTGGVGPYNVSPLVRLALTRQASV